MIPLRAGGPALSAAVVDEGRGDPSWGGDGGGGSPLPTAVGGRLGGGWMQLSQSTEGTDKNHKALLKKGFSPCAQQLGKGHT